MKKYLFIINPVSGKGRGRKHLPEIKDYLEKMSISHEIVITEKPGHATLIANERQNLFDVIVSVGGDGTLNEIINGIDPGSKTILGVIPIGSGNDFAFNLLMSKNIEESLDIICRNENHILCDVCELEYSNGKINSTKKRFINNFGLGFDAQVAYINQHKKIGSGITSYIIAVLRALMKYKSINYTLSFENERIIGEKLLLTFGNGTSSGGGFYLTPNAKINDNLLDITTIEFISRFKLLQKLPMALINKMETVKEAKMYKAEKAHISLNGDFYIHTDGEANLISADKISVKVLNDKLKFINSTRN